MRIGAVELAAFDERGDHGSVVTACVGAGEQRIFAIQGQGPDASLDRVAVELDATVVAEAGESFPAGERVVDCVGELAPGAGLAKPGIELDAQVVDDNAAALGSSGAALLGRKAAHLVLHDVEQGDPPQHVFGNRRSRRQLVELASDVRPAEREHELLPLPGERGVAAVAATWTMPANVPRWTSGRSAFRSAA
jgi:hypothetical protein